ncbi:MAG TPA: hypothetical protein VF101_17500 [Gaiellaceae bacterium]
MRYECRGRIAVALLEADHEDAVLRCGLAEAADGVCGGVRQPRRSDICGDLGEFQHLSGDLGDSALAVDPEAVVSVEQRLKPSFLMLDEDEPGIRVVFARFAESQESLQLATLARRELPVAALDERQSRLVSTDAASDRRLAKPLRRAQSSDECALHNASLYPS